MAKKITNAPTANVREGSECFKRLWVSFTKNFIVALSLFVGVWVTTGMISIAVMGGSAVGIVWCVIATDRHDCRASDVQDADVVDLITNATDAYVPLFFIGLVGLLIELSVI